MINEIIFKANKYFNDTVSLSGVSITEDNFVNGIINTGNAHLIATVLKKAIKKETITICFFGGSITAGAAAASPPPDESKIKVGFSQQENIYCNRIANWFRYVFGCEVKMFNAGIGATDTQLATHRLAEDVLCHNPDLVINEWSMNDNPKMSQKWTTYESVVKKLLAEGIAVLLYAFCGSTGFSSQDIHATVAEHYNVPMLSYKNAFFTHPQFKYFSNDNVHPNQLGHPLAALQICHYFTEIVKNIDGFSQEYTLPCNNLYPLVDSYNGAYVARIKDIENGLHRGIRIVDYGSFCLQGETRRHGSRDIIPYIAQYSKDYKPMIIEVESAKSVHLLNYKRKCLDDGSYMLRINGNNIIDESLNSACGHSFDYVWASDRVYYNENAKKLTIEIIPTCKKEGDFVSIFALLLV